MKFLVSSFWLRVEVLVGYGSGDREDGNRNDDARCDVIMFVGELILGSVVIAAAIVLSRG